MAKPWPPEGISETEHRFLEDFARVMADVRDVVGVYDVDGRAIYVNKAGEALVDHPLHGDTFHLLHAEDRERVRHQFNEVVRTEMPDRFQARILSRGGTYRSMDVQLSPVTDMKGRVIAVLGISRDVTTDVRDRAALQGVLRTLFDQAPIGVAITDPTGRFRAVNGRLREMLGYGWPELAGMRMAELVHPDDRAKAKGLMEELSSGNIDRFSIEKRMLRPAGEVWLASCVSAMVRPPVGGERFVVNIMDDITAERKVANDLRGRNDLIQRIFEYAPIGIAITDRNAHYVRANHRFLEMLGYSEEELMGLSGWDVIHPDDRGQSMKLRDELFAGRRENFTWERRYLKKDGSSIWVHNTVALVTGENDEKYAIALIEDITQRRLSDAAVQASAERLHALSRRLVELQEIERREIARELHDRVGQTLTAMRINMDMIRTRLGATGDAEIRRRNDDSIELIESAFKAVENVMYELRPPMLEEYGVVAALQWLGRQFSQRTGIHVDVQGDEKERCTPEVELAAYRIVQEALTNVSRHSHATRVAITVHASRPKVLMVEDNGVGFDAAAPDLQAGYGMITMRERAEAVGGTLEVRSTRRAGTRIVLTLPVRHP